MRYLTVEEVIQINVDLPAGGLVIDAGLLASAVGRPEQTVGGEDAYPDLFTKTAALYHSLCTNHGFVDGNKRTATVGAIHMLNWNGYNLVADQCDVIDLAVRTASHELNVQKIAEFFEEHAVPIGYPELDDEPAQADPELGQPEPEAGPPAPAVRRRPKQ